MRRLALWLSWLLMFVVPSEDLVETGALGTIVRIVGLALAGVWVLSTLAAGRVRQPRAIHGVMIGYVLWCAASTFWSLAPDDSELQTLTYVQLVLLVLIVYDLYETPADLNSSLQAYVFGNWVCGLVLLQGFASGDVHRRFTAGTYNENTLGFTLALALPMAWYLATTGRHRIGFLGERAALLLRISNLAFIPVGIFGISLTASRASMASALAAVGYMGLSLGRVPRGARIVLIAGAVAAAAYGVTLVPQAAQDRLMTTSAEMSDGDWNHRFPIWREALRLVSERPFTGVGIHAFHEGAVETNSAPHNFVLSITGELGVVGLAIFLCILVGCGLSALRQPRDLGVFWLAMLVVWGLNAATHNLEDKKQTWLLFGLIAVSEVLYRTPGAAPRASAPRPDVARPAARASASSRRVPG